MSLLVKQQNQDKQPKPCNLCREKPATHKKSHIITKSLGKTLLLAPDGKSKAFKVGSWGRSKKPDQDIPKEKGILCPDCEHRLNDLAENGFINQFLRELERAPKLSSPYGYDLKLVRNYSYHDFKLMLYIQLWRAHISSLDAFQYLTLRPDCAESLRRMLNGEAEFISLPASVLACDDDPDPTRNVIHAHSASPDEHVLWAGEYVIIFRLGEAPYVVPYFNDIEMVGEDPIKVGILPPWLWDEWRNKQTFAAFSRQK